MQRITLRSVRGTPVLLVFRVTVAVVYQNARPKFKDVIFEIRTISSDNMGIKYTLIFKRSFRLGRGRRRCSIVHVSYQNVFSNAESACTYFEKCSEYVRNGSIWIWARKNSTNDIIFAYLYLQYLQIVFININFLYYSNFNVTYFNICEKKLLNYTVESLLHTIHYKMKSYFKIL